MRLAPQVPDSLDIGVRKRSLAPVDVVQNRLVGGLVQGRGFVLRQVFLPQGIGAHRQIDAAFGFPLLKAVVVGNRRAVKRGFEVGLGVGAA